MSKEALTKAKDAAKKALGSKKVVAPKIEKNPKEPKAAKSFKSFDEAFEAAKKGMVMRGYNVDHNRWQKVAIIGKGKGGAYQQNRPDERVIHGVVLGTKWDVDETDWKKGWILQATKKEATEEEMTLQSSAQKKVDSEKPERAKTPPKEQKKEEEEEVAF
jgi:hypothetical protein